jgi:signal transduction histidine kinase
MGGEGGEQHPCAWSGEERDLRNRIDRLMRLLQVGQIITSEINFDVLFDLILEQTTDIMEAERCSIFLIDRSKRYLRAFVSTDLKRNEIQIEKDHGIAGWVFSNRTAAIIDHPYEDPRFCREVDKITGYLTRSILCVPMINRRDECIGTLQVLNKKSGRFSEDDRHLLGYLASFTTIALENSLLYEELMASDAAKQKVIDHLSHELKTPLAVIAGVFRRLSGLIPAGDHPEAARAIARGERNVGRLEAMQEKVADIIHSRAAGDDAARYVELLDRLADIVEELEAEEIGVHRRLLERLREKIESIYQVPPSAITTLELGGFLEDRRCHAAQEAAFRDIALRARIETGLTIEMDPVVLAKVMDGLLKNAIENTPDQGTVAVEAAAGENEVTITVRDTGVGIAENDRKNIFGGFFHTQKTENYATKRPYHFNAGGSGSDLLRVRAFSERFGFRVAVGSRRCPHLRTDADVCPGAVGACPHVGSPAECAASGGSEFILRFPAPQG